MESTSQFEKEIAELKQFIAELKNDRAAQKEKREAWTKYTSMSLVFIAVLAAVAMQWSGKYSSRVLVNLNEDRHRHRHRLDLPRHEKAQFVVCGPGAGWSGNGHDA